MFALFKSVVFIYFIISPRHRDLKFFLLICRDTGLINNIFIHPEAITLFML